MIGEVWHHEMVEGPNGYFLACQLCERQILAGELAAVLNDPQGDACIARCPDHASPVDAARAVLVAAMKSGTRYTVTMQGSSNEFATTGYIETWDDNESCEFLVRTNPKGRPANGIGLNPENLARIAHSRKSKGGVIWDAIVPTMAEEIAVIQGLQRIVAEFSA